jgi:hypothetical protein
LIYLLLLLLKQMQSIDLVVAAAVDQSLLSIDPLSAVNRPSLCCRSILSLRLLLLVEKINKLAYS